MTGIIRKPRVKLKTFNVGYYLEQGFSINVKAKSASGAERIVRTQLNHESGELAGSTRVHYDDDVLLGATEVRS